MTAPVFIGNRPIGPGAPCFVIAEAGVNHNGDMDLARGLIDAARKAGADAVKFQSFKADRLASKATPKAEYQKRLTGENESQQEMLRRLELSEKMHFQLLEHCRQQGILFLSSPFDEQSADFLCTLGVEALKIPSGEITNTPYLEHLATLQLPLILSTGMSFHNEVEEAVQVIEQAGDPGLVLLHCLSNYPADPAECNLRAMATMATALNRPVGFSDHTVGNEVALAAVALGAVVIEKHFTLDRALPGPDHQASLEPQELAALVTGIRAVESALGDGFKQPAPSEAANRRLARKSLVAAQPIPAGTVLTRDLIAAKRPGTGISPKHLKELFGCRVRVDLEADTLLSAATVELGDAGGVLEQAD